MRIKVVVGAGLALVAGVVLVLLLGQAERRSGGNYVDEQGPTVQLSGGQTHCEVDQLLPGDTGALKLLLGTYGRPTPPIEVTATAPGRGVVTRGSLAAGHAEGRLVIPVKRVDDTVEHADVCIRLGGKAPNVLYGSGTSARLSWLRPGTESRLDLLPTVAHRIGLAKLNPFGSWLLLVLVVALAAAWTLALRLVLREVGP